MELELPEDFTYLSKARSRNSQLEREREEYKGTEFIWRVFRARTKLYTVSHKKVEEKKQKIL